MDSFIIIEGITLWVFVLLLLALFFCFIILGCSHLHSERRNAVNKYKIKSLSEANKKLHSENKKLYNENFALKLKMSEVDTDGKL